MKQLMQNMRSGKIEIKDVPVTPPGTGRALVRTAFSLVSAGTEKMLAEFAEKSLVGKAASRPDLVRQVIDKARREGILTTMEAALNRLDQPMSPGYSSAGTIVALGAGMTGFQVGDRVACGGGGFAVHAEYCLVPQNLLVKIPDSVSLEEAAFATLGSVALHGFRLSEPQLNETVLVVGLGLLGLMTAQIAQAAGCKVMGIDISPERVAFARTFGIDACLNDQIVESSAPFTRGRGFDHILICAGSKSSDTIELAGALCRDRGSVVCVGAVGLDIPRKPFYEKEIRFIVSRSYGPGRYDLNYEEKGRDYPLGYVRWTEGRNMEGFVDLLSSGKMDVKRLISHRVPIDDGAHAYDLIKGKFGEPFLGVLFTYGEFSEEAINHEPIVLQPNVALEKIAVGVIGAGNYANATFLPVLKLPKEPVSLVSVASGRGGSARDAAEKYGFAKVDADSSALIHDPDVNTVVILTRHDLHSRLAMDALSLGKNVYCEKPLALDIESLQAVGRAARQHPEARLMTGFNRRFAPVALRLKSFLEGAAEPLVIQYTVNAGYIPPTHWVHDAETGGGRIIGEACHMIDFLQFLTGSRPVQVSAVGLPDFGKYHDDNVLMQFKMEDGSLGTIHYLANGDRSFPKEHVEVFCGGRIAVLDDFRRLETWHEGSHQRSSAGLKMDKGHAGSWEAFVNCIALGAPAPISLESMMETTLATFAVMESIRVNDTVLIPGADSLA